MSQSKRYDDDFDLPAKSKEEAKVDKTDFAGRSAAGNFSNDEVQSHQFNPPTIDSPPFLCRGPLISRGTHLHVDNRVAMPPGQRPRNVCSFIAFEHLFGIP